MKKILFILFIISNFAIADYDEGIDYIKLEKAVPTTTGKQIEVRELFWYYCPHCYYLEPSIKNWLKHKSAKVDFIRQPAIFSKSWEKGAVFYYVLDSLGLVDKLHEPLFDAIHLQKKQFLADADFINWVASFGIDKEKIKQAIKSFAVRIQLNKSNISSHKYKVSGVPAIIVNGKYSVDAKNSGSYKEMLKIVDYLVKKELK